MNPTQKSEVEIAIRCLFLFDLILKRVIIRKEPNEGYVVYSEGSNLKEVLDIEGVDPYRTTTNDIHAIARELGIEAARNMIIQEVYNFKTGEREGRTQKDRAQERSRFLGYT